MPMKKNNRKKIQAVRREQKIEAEINVLPRGKRAAARRRLKAGGKTADGVGGFGGPVSPIALMALGASIFRKG